VSTVETKLSGRAAIDLGVHELRILVLQGRGALGAYQAGVYEGLDLTFRYRIYKAAVSQLSPAADRNAHYWPTSTNSLSTIGSQLRVSKREVFKQNGRRFASRVWEFRQIAYKIQCELLQSLGMLSR
jgi:hypothetical protein